MAVTEIRCKAKKVGSNDFTFISMADYQSAKIDKANGIFRIGDDQYQLATLVLETVS